MYIKLQSQLPDASY